MDLFSCLFNLSNGVKNLCQVFSPGFYVKIMFSSTEALMVHTGLLPQE